VIAAEAVVVMPMLAKATHADFRQTDPVLALPAAKPQKRSLPFLADAPPNG
jgi:hypothetical protein